jgi:hypothetical protein
VKRTCGTCNAFDPVLGGNGNIRKGSCRASSPGVMQGMSQASVVSGQMVPVIQGVWPPTNSEQWCRMWEKNDE